MSLKSYLEGLEIGDQKTKLPEDIVKNILAESGKVVDTEKGKVEESYKTKISNYETTINELKEQVNKAPKSDEIEKLKTQIADFEAKENQRIADEKAKHEDEILTQNIVASFGDKEFVNDFTKQAIINEVKQGLANENNAGKSAKDIFDEVTKDRQDIFVNPNQVKDMSGMGEVPNSNDIDAKAFAKMGYKERLEFKNENPKLFEQLNK